VRSRWQVVSTCGPPRSQSAGTATYLGICCESPEILTVANGLPTAGDN
jgi:hypothetical protein